MIIANNGQHIFIGDIIEFYDRSMSVCTGMVVRFILAVSYL